MSRRSARLASGGYYQSDDDSNSSTASVSYKENSVKVFNKRRTGGRKTASSRASSRATSTASTHPHAVEEPINAEDYPGTDDITSAPGEAGGGMAHALRAVKRRQTFRPPPSMAPAPVSFLTPALTLTLAQAPSLSLLSPALSTSGYSSSDGASTTTTTSTCYSSVPSPPPAPARPLFTDGVRKAILHVLLLLLFTLGFWYLFPMLTLLAQNFTMTQSVPHTPLTPLAPRAMDGTAVLNSALEAKMKTILKEMELLKQMEHQQMLVSETVQRLQTDVKEVRVRVERVDSEQQVRLYQEVTDLRAEQTSARSVTTRLNHEMSGLKRVTTRLRQRVETQEVQSAMLQQDLSSVQVTPPEPCPTASPPVNTGLTQELREAMEKWFTDRAAQDMKKDGQGCSPPMADKMPDFALESQGASVVNSRSSKSYHTRSPSLTLFGFPLWYPSESPRTVIQGNPVLLPGKCWAFQGSQGTMAVSLSHPIKVTHVTLDHLPRCNSPNGQIHSAPKDFQVYGMSTDTEEGTLLGKFTYDQDGEPTQTFKLPNPSDSVFRFVELRIISNWGQLEYTCLYRFRVHGHIAV